MTSGKVWPGVGPVTPLGHGLWLDNDGNIHIAVGEVLRELGATDTPKNRATVARHLQQQWASGAPLPVALGSP